MQLFLQRIFDGLNNGAVYAINDSTLFSVVPEPSAAAIFTMIVAITCIQDRRGIKFRHNSRA